MTEISPAATSKLLVFNAIKRSRADSIAVGHNLDCETALLFILACSSTTKHANGISLTNYLRKQCVLWQSAVTLHWISQYSNWQIWERRLCLLCNPNKQTVHHWISQPLIYLESIIALQYLSHNMSQMMNGVVRVFSVILDNNETTVSRASNVQKG